MRVGLVQMRSGRDPASNLEMMADHVRACAAEGAVYVQTPEMTNALNRDRQALFDSVDTQENDRFVAVASELARELGIFLHLGSLALRRGQTDGGPSLVNRAILFDQAGEPLCRYDKVHMFDVDVDADNRWRESSAYQAGAEVPVADIGDAVFGLAICYDMRFPALARAQAQAGAEVLTFPSSFTRVTGEAHWRALLKARAIENGAYVLAAAQGGDHEDGRQTYGHSLVYSPWGDLVGELDHAEPGHLVVDLDTTEVARARKRVPSLTNDRDFTISRYRASGVFADQTD